MTKCEEENKYVVLKSTGTAIKELICQDNGDWNMDVDDLICAQSCVHEEIHYAIGDTRILPRPRIGFRWVNFDGEVILRSRFASITHLKTQRIGHTTKKKTLMSVPLKLMCAGPSVHA